MICKVVAALAFKLLPSTCDKPHNLLQSNYSNDTVSLSLYVTSKKEPLDMPKETAVIVFTFKSIEHLVREGGTSAWRLDRNHARKCTFAVCTRNAEAVEVEGKEEHHSAFLVGKISNVVPASGYEEGERRYLILFSEYARVSVPNAWKGDRNPVRYGSLEELGIDPSTLKWEAMPSPETVTPVPVASKKAVEVEYSNTTGPLTMADAKKGLALTFGVQPEAIEITIRG